MPSTASFPSPPSPPPPPPSVDAPPRVSGLRALAMVGLLLSGLAAIGAGLAHQAVVRAEARTLGTATAHAVAHLIAATLQTAPPDAAIQALLDHRLSAMSDPVPLRRVIVTDGAGRRLYAAGDAVEVGVGVGVGAGNGVGNGNGDGAGATDDLVVLLPLIAPPPDDAPLPATTGGTERNGTAIGAGASAMAEVVLDLSAPLARGTRRSWEIGLGLAGTLGAFCLALGLATRRIERRLERQQRRVAEEIAERAEAEMHLRRIQDAMENTIAERTRQLRDSEGRFRSFAESASDWLWETDEDGRFTFVSDRFRRLLGIEPASLVGLRLVDLRADPAVTATPGGGDEAWQRHFDDVAARRPFRAFAFALALPGGGTRTVSLSGQPIFDDRGRFRGYRGTGTDLTHQHEAEQTITRLGRILDQSANEVLIFLADSQRIVQANRGARRNLGYAMDDLRLMTPLDVMPGEQPEAFAARLRFLRQRPAEVAVFETLHRRRDGSQYPAEVRLQFATQEQPPVFVAVAQDITARKRTEQALQESEERYRSIAEMSLDAIIVHVDGQIVYGNRQALAMAHAASPEALVGQPIESFITPEFRPVLRDRLTRMHATGKPTERAEIILLRCDGTRFEAELSSSPITYGGRAATQTVLRDITETKAVQTQLIQAAKLATLGEMAAGMAHELSQPMNVIRMAAEGALLDAPDGAGTGTGAGVGGQARTALGIIVSQAARMGEIIDHMRIFSRKEAEPLTVFDPALSVRQALNMVEAQFYAEDISITARYPTGSHGVRGRTVHLEQVLLNLLTNARDSIRARFKRQEEGFHGQISLDTSVSTDGHTLTIEVSDNGGGIPAGIIDRIFEPFYTTKEVGTDTGLGLSVSFSLVAAMGGSITVRNTGPGAAFRIDLPLVRPGSGQDAEAAPRAPAALPPGGRTAAAPAAGGEDGDDDDEPSALIGHVLVVDDEPFATKLVADHLESLGYRVSSAFDGEEAYRKFLDDPPDLLITDLRMPRCDGAELVRRVHGHVPGLPVVVVTGHLGHLEAATAELKAHSAAILKKPISLAELGALVERLVSFPNRAGLG